MTGQPITRPGLYDPGHEHDACGIGAVVNVTGRRDHDVIRLARQVLLNLRHRGAAGSDEATGDGAGILIQLPHELFAAEAERLGFDLPAPGVYGAAAVFAPRDGDLARRGHEALDEAVAHYGLKVLGRREVPARNDGLGPLARHAEPVVSQVFIDAQGAVGEALERRLFMARKRAERLVRERLGPAGQGFYICSMSARTIVYKGMFLAPQLFAYYGDLTDERVRTALALVHQRYSTNTFPNWRLAQPMRLIAHNGEINTLNANRNRMRARERSMACPDLAAGLPPAARDRWTDDLLPVLTAGASDSAQFDNCLELLLRAGRTLPHAMMMMVPEAFGPSYHISTDKRAFYEYHAAIMEPWDGPAAMVFTDGRLVGGTLDRNGLRPARYVVTTDDLLVLASEVGVIDFPPERIRAKGRLQPGRMLLVDTDEGRIVPDNEIKSKVARRRPYRRWLEANRIELRGLFDAARPAPADARTLARRLRAFGYTREELNGVLAPMAANGQEPVGSMGTDTPLAVLSDRPRLLFDYFKQRFAQVTNPPIDPLREGLVMSLMHYAGRRRNLLEETPEHCRQLKLPHPVLTNEDLRRLRAVQRRDFRVATVPAVFDARATDAGAALRRGLDAMLDAARRAIDDGASLLIVSDRDVGPDAAAIPSLLAVGRLHHGLLDDGLRGQAGIVVESGEPREVMHFCLLVGCGANAVNPYLALEALDDLHRRGDVPADIEPEHVVDHYVNAVKKGLLKTMSKMGISTLRSYRSGQLFECIGLDREVIDSAFAGTDSRVAGAGFEAIARDALRRHADAFARRRADATELDYGGEYHFRRDGEHHLWNPDTVAGLQHAARGNDPEAYRAYARAVNDQSRRLCTLRGLFELDGGEPVALEEIEPAAEIVKRFYTGAMSHGSISREAHETLAVAMNRLGTFSNTGEGGEDPDRYRTRDDGESSNCGIKQVASGR